MLYFLYMEELVIKIDWIWFLGIIGTLITIAFIAGGKFSKLETSISWIKETVTKLEGRMDNAFGSASPVKLMEKGLDVLNSSGLKEYIDKNQDALISNCGLTKLHNQYDIQEKAFNCLDRFDFGDFENKLKKVSFERGMSIEIIRRIGGIYFRDILLAKNGFAPEDLDKPKTTDINK